MKTGPFKKSRHPSRGFTLVEIMMVVCIMGVLMNIAAPQMVKARDRAQTKTCVANLHNIYMAKEQYILQNNVPTTPAQSISWVQVQPYLRSTINPVCPATQQPLIPNDSGTLPTCSTQNLQGQYIHVF